MTDGEPDTSAATGHRRGSALSIGVVSALTAASGIISGPLVARALGPVGRGEVASAMVYFSILTVVFSLGLPLAVGHSVGAGTLSAEGAMGAVLRYCAILILPCTAVSAALLHGPLRGLTGSSRIWAGVLLSCVPLPILGLSVTYCLLAEGALGPLAIIQAIQPSLVTVTAAGLFVVGALTIASYLSVTIVAILASATATLILLGKRPARGASLRPLLRYGLHGYLGTIASFAAVRADQAVIGPVLGQAKLGLYAVGATIASLPPTLALAIAYRSFGNVASAEEHMKPAIITASVRLSVLVAGLFATALAIFSPIVLPALYGDRFEGSVTPLLLLLPGSVALSVSGVIGAILTATGRLKRATSAELTGFGLSVVGLWVVVPRWGLTGAATLSTVAYSVTMTSYVRSLKVSVADLIPRRAEAEVLARVALGPLQLLRSRASRAGG